MRLKSGLALDREPTNVRQLLEEVEASVIDELFSPFVRGTEGRGMGLGLAIARRAVEAHGGQIRVQNLPGKGCVFIANIPAEPPEPPDGPAANRD